MAASWQGWGRRSKPAGAQPVLTLEQAAAYRPARIFARALLEHAGITEQYFVAQEVSNNSWTRPDRVPEGRIELAMPYDGHEYFTRAAREDVARQIASHSQQGSSAVIGHLLLSGYGSTDLAERLPLDDRHGSIDIEVPLGDGGPGGIGELSADRRLGATTVEFRPGTPEVIPAQLDIDLFDPDSLDLPLTDLRAFDIKTDDARRRVNEDIERIAQNVGFQDELFLRVAVRLSLPARTGPGPLRPRVARVAVKWPTITSLQALRVMAGDPRRRSDRLSAFAGLPVRYNPEQGCIEWHDVPMYAAGDKIAEHDTKASGTPDAGDGERPGGGDPDQAGAPGAAAQGQDADPGEQLTEEEPDTSGLRHYLSGPMVLSIGHPGELYKETGLTITAEVQVPGYLLSGMSARLYDSTGYFLAAPLTLTTKVRATATLMLDDAFAKRDRSPSQQLFFDEVLPAEMRITDITTALEDRGFAVRKVWPTHDGPQVDEDTGTLSWLYVARRQVGPDDMILWILAAGRLAETERRTLLPGNSVTHLTTLASGEFRLFVRGSLPRDTEGRLTQEMNVLHGMLRERYGRVRQRR